MVTRSPLSMVRTCGRAASMRSWTPAGFFSWVLVLTVARDATLLAALAFLPLDTFAAWVRLSALGVLVLAPAVTAIGFAMARMVPRVVHVDIPIEGLPK